MLLDQSCFTCNGTNWIDCQSNGQIEQCKPSQVCQIEVRRQRGRAYRVAMGCKWRHACENNKIQNFEGPEHAINYPRSYEEFQCHNNLWWRTGSICRQCCDGHANCGMEFIKSNENFDERYADFTNTKDLNGPKSVPSRNRAWEINLYNSVDQTVGKAEDETY